jgi:hypothetical protein
VRTRLASRSGEVMNESLCLELKNAIPVFVFTRGPTFFRNKTDAPPTMQTNTRILSPDCDFFTTPSYVIGPTT